MPKTWFITGSSRGLGRALTTAVLDRGDQVVATARTPDQLSDLVDRYGDLVRACRLDVTDADAARDAVDVALATFGRIDVVVNNAGYADSAPFEEVSAEDFRAQVEANFFGVVNVTRAVLPVMHRQRAGHVVQISSIGGRVGGSPGIAAYQAAKFAVAGFSRGTRRRGRPARHQGHHRRTGRLPHGLGRIVHGHRPRSAPTTKRRSGRSTNAVRGSTASRRETRPGRLRRSSRWSV